MVLDCPLTFSQCIANVIGSTNFHIYLFASTEWSEFSMNESLSGTEYMSVLEPSQRISVGG